MSSEIEIPGYLVGQEGGIDPIFALQHQNDQKVQALIRRLRGLPVIKTSGTLIDPSRLEILDAYKYYRRANGIVGDAEQLSQYNPLANSNEDEVTRLDRLLKALQRAGQAGPVKQADHPQERLEQRTNLPADYTKRLRRVIATGKLPKGNLYARMPDNSFAVFKDAGGKKRLASFLSKTMKPHGKDVTTQVREGLHKTSAFANEALAQQAHKAVAEDHGLSPDDGSKYWKLKTQIYKKMGGTFTGKARAKVAGRPIKAVRRMLRAAGLLEKNQRVADATAWQFLNGKGNPANPLNDIFSEASRVAEGATNPSRGNLFTPWYGAESHLHGALGSEGIHFNGTLSDAILELKNARKGLSGLKEASAPDSDKLRGLLKSFKDEADKQGHNYFFVMHDKDGKNGAEVSSVKGHPESPVREHKRLHAAFAKRVGAEHVDWSEKKAEIYYHGSPKKLDSIRSGSWVTPHKDDALSFGVPWSSKDLVDSGGPDGRPPTTLEFKPGKSPKDGPVYLYEMDSPAVEAASTNTGKDYSWNRKVTESTPVKLVESYPSWKDKLNRG